MIITTQPADGLAVDRVSTTRAAVTGSGLQPAGLPAQGHAKEAGLFQLGRQAVGQPPQCLSFGRSRPGLRAAWTRRQPAGRGRTPGRECCAVALILYLYIWGHGCRRPV